MITIYKIFAKHLLNGLFFFWLIMALIPGIHAQEGLVHKEQDLNEPEELLKTIASPDKSTPIRLNVVGGGAWIHGLTVGRGAGNISTNSAFGDNALASNTTGDRNTAIGSWALIANTTGSFNTAVGRWAMRYNTVGIYNTAMGFVALRDNLTGDYNTTIGYQAMEFNISGFSNVAIGNSALRRNTNLSNLVAVGDSALFWNGYQATGTFEGEFNTAVGSKALYSNTSGYNCTAVGDRALEKNTSGRWNTAVGGVALKSITSGQSNTALGVIALGNITTQSNNTAVGYLAGHYRTSISEGTFLGANSYPSTNTTNVTGVGYNSRPTKSNQLVLGNSAVTEILYYGKWASGSDARYKNNIREDVSGLDFILKLRPVTYNMDIHKLADLLKEDTQIDEEGNEKMGAPNEATLKARDKKSAIIYSGFIAQEVEAVAKEVGYDFSGVIAPENDHDYYKLDYISLTVPIVKAIQEQQVQIELLEPAAVEALQAEVQALRAENEIMKDQLSQILSLLKEQGIDLGSGSAGNPSRGSGRSPRNAYGNSAQLEQNTPNPFHENTSIRYFLPENAGKAQIVITDLQGNRIQTLNIGGSGFGEVTIHGGSLAPGTYVYSLVVGGELADSKRMVLVL